MGKNLIIIIIILFINCKSGFLYSQDAIFSQLYGTSLYLNPAFAGVNIDTRLTLNYRNHPFSETSGYSTIYASLDMNIPKVHGGLGLIVLSDNRGGLYEKTQLAGIYSFHLQVTADFFISFGLQAEYHRNDLRWDRLSFLDPNEPPPNNQLVNHSASFASGILAYNDIFYGGISVHHLNKPLISSISPERLARKYSAHLGFYFETPQNRRANTVGFDYLISPNIIFQSQENFNRINLGLYFGVDQLMTGVWFRHNLENTNTIIFMLGLKINNYRISYSYDHSLSGYSDLFHAAHEITLSLDFLNSRQQVRTRRLHCPPF